MRTSARRITPAHRKVWRRASLMAALSGAASMAWQITAGADQDDWVTGSGNWSVNGNWSLNHAPLPGDSATLGISGATVTYDAAATTGFSAANSLFAFHVGTSPKNTSSVPIAK